MEEEIKVVKSEDVASPIGNYRIGGSVHLIGMPPKLVVIDGYLNENLLPTARLGSTYATGMDEREHRYAVPASVWGLTWRPDRVCSKCGERKLLSKFRIRKMRGKMTMASECQECERTRKRGDAADWRKRQNEQKA